MRISVIIPAYNAAAYIERALRSVLSQTRAADEVIVVDDGSSDNTADILKKYQNQIISIRQPNAGVSAARNTGIRAATGDWIAFLDADDEWLPEKLELQCAYHREHPDIKWSSANYYRCHCSKNHRRTEDLPNTPQGIAKDTFDDYFQAYLAMAKGHTDTMLIRRDVLLEAGLFFEPQKNIEDDDLWFRLGYMNLRFGFIREPLSVYHLGNYESITKNYIQPRWIDTFLSRHIALARQARKTESFDRCATCMLGFWIHKLLLGGQGETVRALLRKHGNLLSAYGRWTSYAGSWFPKLWRWNEKRKHPEAE
jgi:glycosyltransferase involved in cell wall biosynthesis